MQIALLVLGLVAGAFGGIVVFHQWLLVKRLRAYRKVIEYMGGALKVHEKDGKKYQSQISELRRDVRRELENHTARIGTLELATLGNIPPDPPEPEGDPEPDVTGGPSKTEAMGARSVEEAVNVWGRLLSEAEE